MTPAGTVQHLARWRGADRIWRFGAALAALLLAVLAVAGATQAAEGPLKPVLIDDTRERVEITALGRLTDSAGGMLQVETAAGTDGVSGRMAVRSSVTDRPGSWFVFSLRNTTDKPVERWITTERYEFLGSRIVWPDLDAGRIDVITPSIGYLPDRVRSDRADVFRVTLEPGQTITYAAELAATDMGRVYVWKPLEYQLKARDRQLFNGIMLGITGLLGIFLTAIFAANHKPIFPSAALVAWCVLGYLCVDFGFWHKLLQLRVDDNSVWRAATEAAIAASLVIFLHIFLRIGSWHAFARMMSSVWMIAQLALVFLAVFDPRLASTFARLSFGLIAGVGAVVILFLAVRGQDRALSLLPTWILFLVWLFAAALAALGRLQGDLVVSGLVSGLVLIVVLIGFTVTQFAFTGGEAPVAKDGSDGSLVARAVDGSGAAVFEWNARRDEIKISPAVEVALGLTAGELSAKVEDVLRHVHEADRERLRILLWSLKERSGGSFRTDFRIRHANNSYRWYDLSAGTTDSGEGRTLRCVGLMRDVTEQKRAHERLMTDAVNDSLTGLPQRRLLLDRLGVALVRAANDTSVRPAIILVDIDRFKSVNAAYGVVVGDSLLLTVARRLERLIGPQDTLARIGGDLFAALVTNDIEPRRLAQLAEEMRRAIKAPIKIAGQDIVLTGALGIAVYDGEQAGGEDLLGEAEIAVQRAKREGADQIEIFSPELRGDRSDRQAIERELREAIDRGQVTLLYQPIIYLPTEELAGFEAIVRWQHPRLGAVDPAAYAGQGDQSDLAQRLEAYVLERAVAEAQIWQRELPRTEHALFVSANLSAHRLMSPDIIQDIRNLIGRTTLAPGSIRLEITEALVMQNPEQASEMLESLRATGVRLSLDDFGAGYSSLAYLQKFPFDTIKIDRSLVQASENAAGGQAIVRSIVALAHELGKRVVAEGVERAEEVGFLRGLACEYAQGFYYGEPMASAEVRQLLRVVRKSERRVQRRGFFRTKPPNERPVADAPQPRKADTAQPPREGGAPRPSQRAPGLPASSVRTVVPNETGPMQAAKAPPGPAFVPPNPPPPPAYVQPQPLTPITAPALPLGGQVGGQLGGNPGPATAVERGGRTMPPPPPPAAASPASNGAAGGMSPGGPNPPLPGLRASDRPPGMPQPPSVVSMTPDQLASVLPPFAGGDATAANPPSGAAQAQAPAAFVFPEPPKVVDMPWQQSREPGPAPSASVPPPPPPPLPAHPGRSGHAPRQPAPFEQPDPIEELAALRSAMSAGPPTIPVAMPSDATEPPSTRRGRTMPPAMARSLARLAGNRAPSDQPPPPPPATGKTAAE